MRAGGGFAPGATLRAWGGGFRDEEGGFAVDFVWAIAGTAKERERDEMRTTETTRLRTKKTG